MDRSHVLVFGDFNFKEINWIDGSVDANDMHPASKFYDTIQDLYLFQHVIKPTRYREGQEPSLLDLIFTNEEPMVDDIEEFAPIGKSDHVGLLWTYTCKVDIATMEDDDDPKPNFNKANYDTMRNAFKAVDWEEDLDGLNSEEAWQKFKLKYNTEIELNVPKKKPKKSLKPKWMKSSVKKAVKKKYNLYKRYKRTQDYRDYEDYKRQNNKTRQIVRKAQANYEKQLMKEFKKKPKQFYSYVRDKQKVKVGIPQLEKEDGTRTDSDGRNSRNPKRFLPVCVYQ